jgi:hypothetical protein
MKKKLFLLCVVAFGFIFLMAMLPSLDGKWAGIIKAPDGNEIQATYNFTTDGDKLTGTASSPYGVVPIDSGKVSGDSFSFQVTVDGNNYPHKGKIYEDSCALDIDFGGPLVHTVLVRDTTK